MFGNTNAHKHSEISDNFDLQAHRYNSVDIFLTDYEEIKCCRYAIIQIGKANKMMSRNEFFFIFQKKSNNQNELMYWLDCLFVC